MITMLKNWEGAVEVNGSTYDNVNELYRANLGLNGTIHIKLYPKAKKAVNEAGNAKKEHTTQERQEYRITVKKYMTQKATPQFDFMAKWNNDEPMPLRMMTGYVDKETRGMVHMVLHGDMYAEKMCTCMKCGKRLTNKVSQYFGIGPECGGHAYVNPFDTQEELDNAVADYKKKLQQITWSGWIIKSSIIEEEEV